MADLFSVTAPLAIRFPGGDKRIMIERLAHENGVLFLPPFWMNRPVQDVLCFVPGPVKGEGPWKVGDAVVQVLGCHGTDPDLAGEFARWQTHLEQIGNYPERAAIEQLMEQNAERATVAGAGFRQ
jgi:hypothetical protein